MSIGLGLGVTIPAAAIGSLTSPGTIMGGSVLQVLNLVTGADATGSFDPYIPANDTIVQLDTTPSQTASHLVVFQQPGQSAPGVRFSVVHSLGSVAGTTGSVAAAGVKKGDIIQRALTPVTKYSLFTGGNVQSIIDCTSSFDPTSPAVGVVTQMTGAQAPVGAVSPDSILLFLRDAGSPALTAGIWIEPNPTSSPLPVPHILAGYKLLAAIDITNVVNYLTYYEIYAPGDGLIVTNPLYSGVIPPNNNILGFVLFLFDKP